MTNKYYYGKNEFKKEPILFMSIIFSNTIQNLNKALGKATERHSLLLTNIANANVPGYKRKDMDFNIQIDQASSNSKQQHLTHRLLKHSSCQLIHKEAQHYYSKHFHWHRQEGFLDHNAHEKGSDLEQYLQ